MQDGEQPETSGLSRRDALRRAAAVGGALVWTVPVVQSMSGTAVAAQGSTDVPERPGPSTSTPPSSTTTPPTTVPTPETSVEGTKAPSTPTPSGGKTPDTVVEGTKLPHTGWPAGEFLAVGLGAVAAGAATRSVARRRQAATEGPEPDSSES
jgi:hypothetical protein